MLRKLQQANEYLGKFMPEELYALTPKEYEFMIVGAQQRRLDQWQHDLDMTYITRPVGLADKNPNDEEYRNSLKKQQEMLDHMTDKDYLKQHEVKEKRKKQLASLFSRFSRQKMQRKE